MGIVILVCITSFNWLIFFIYHFDKFCSILSNNFKMRKVTQNFGWQSPFDLRMVSILIVAIYKTNFYFKIVYFEIAIN